MAEFDPRQLDQLEDALERIDDRTDLESLELSAELSERLGEYQDVLGLCRDAFPIEEPSDALLSEVIAEAHEVTRRSRPGPEPGAWRQFWHRWRGTLIPGVALAGTAAALLLWLEPDAQLSASLPSDRDDKREQVQTDERPEPASEPSIDPQPDQPELGVDTHAEPDELDIDRAGGGGSVEPDPEQRRPSKRKKTPAIEPEPTPEPTPLSKDDTWAELEQADAARRKGKCGDARGHYESIIEASADNYAIAQARAGIGLCLEQQRRDDEAEAWFDKARATSPGVDSWIERERDEQPLPGEFSKHKSAPSEAKKAAPSKKNNAL